jgi:recombination protein RecT
MATQAETTANPVAVIRQNLQQMEPEFKAALPPHIPVEKFKRVALTAIQNTPALINADRRSLFGAFVRLAQDGLLPDGREAAIVMFGNKAQAMPMIAGILKKIRQSGEVAKVSAQVVYANDKFVVKYGFDEDVEHIPPALNEPRGDPIGAYATAVLKDGSQLLEVMSLEDIQAVRKVSRAANNGPWVSWFGEMARKTVMRRLSKRLPMSTDLEDEVFSRDPTMQPSPHHIERTIDAEPSESPRLSRLDAIESSIPDAEEAQAEEVIEEQAEELEAVIDQPEAHPGKAIADRIIAEIKEAAAILDVGTILTAHDLDLASMLEEDAVRVEVAADQRRNAIRAAREKAGAKEAAE